MKNETLQRAKQLEQQIKEFKSAMSCFEWGWYGSEDEKPDDFKPDSTNPKVIIEFDGGDGREQIALPMSLSDAFIEFMKKEITAGLTEAQSELDEL